MCPGIFVALHINVVLFSCQERTNGRLQDVVLYGMVAVKLDEGVRMVGQLHDATADYPFTTPAIPET
jgi:hypothetical protein